MKIEKAIKEAIDTRDPLVISMIARSLTLHIIRRNDVRLDKFIEAIESTSDTRNDWLRGYFAALHIVASTAEFDIKSDGAAYQEFEGFFPKGVSNAET